MSYVIVFFGGGLGAAARHAVNVLAARIAGFSFPWGTLTVNVVGSFVMGLLIAWLALRGDGGTMRMFVTTGFLGGFTTFSAFSLDAANLFERGDAGLAALYVGGSVIASVAALFLGLALGRA